MRSRSGKKRWWRGRRTVTRIVKTEAVLLQRLQTKQGPTTFVHMLTCHIFHGSPAKGGGRGRLESDNGGQLEHVLVPWWGASPRHAPTCWRPFIRLARFFLGLKIAQKILNVWFISACWMLVFCTLFYYFQINNLPFGTYEVPCPCRALAIKVEKCPFGKI